MMNGYDMNGWGWVGMTLMAVVTVAIVGLVVWAIVRRPGDPQVHEPSARQQLDARLARGEIDAPEYRERLEALSGRSSGG
jgi:putative membrane protein